EKKVDIILANIIRIVILENFSLFKSQLGNDGVLLLSGLLEEDEAEIMQAAGNYGFKFINRLKRENWLCLKFEK
ncbi:MAG: 50S ribosomal protein L11 methyltransferase, partial [Chitinophagaceae bacterium]|nr:50S ribosomal protein L11 methyltransferase [Chitinophagaceae bacterium]